MFRGHLQTGAAPLESGRGACRIQVHLAASKSAAFAGDRLPHVARQGPVRGKIAIQIGVFLARPQMKIEKRVGRLPLGRG